MVRRGGRAGSMSASSSGSRWARSRPNSAADGEAGRKKISDSAKSSPGVQSSPIKKSSQLKSHRGTNWRSRGATRSMNSSPTDPKFSITNEDFPALPGADGEDCDKEPGQEPPRPDSTDSSAEISRCVSSTDDSGLSSGSRGATPFDENEAKKAKNDKRKTPSPTKELFSRPSSKISGGNSRFFNGSPKKKITGTPTSSSSPNSFIKLYKSGQKVPERRGLKNETISSGKDEMSSEVVVQKVEESVRDESLKNKEELKHQEQQLKPVPKIKLGVDGEMTNIPSTMIIDQFGMAATLPLLNILKTKNLPAENLSAEAIGEKILNENIEMLSIGVDLNALGIPMINQDTKPVWTAFAGPFEDYPAAPTAVSLEVNQIPSVYYTARTLQSSFDMNHRMPEKLGIQELFYVFYNFPNELWQMNAARELQNRGWRFNVKEKIWVNRKMGETDEFGIASTLGPIGSAVNFSSSLQPVEDNVLIGVFQVYDAEKARISTREMRLLRSDFEQPAWEHHQKKRDDQAHNLLLSSYPPEALWGPRNGGTAGAAVTGSSSSAAGSSALEERLRNHPIGSASVRNAFNRAPNTVPPAPRTRRMLSFADAPDYPAPSFDAQVVARAAEPAVFRQQMLNALMQQASSQQHQTSSRFNFQQQQQMNSAQFH